LGYRKFYRDIVEVQKIIWHFQKVSI
jgi:hypothetical protein